jgi:PIN domain nuclease of toxin-antitoxin system
VRFGTLRKGGSKVPLLLDTCALIWVANDEPISPQALQAIEAAADTDSIFVSPISAWEIGNLTRKGRLRLSMPPEAWFEAALALPGLRLAEMPPRTLVASAYLPGDPPTDPADRILAASARAENVQLVTRDRKLLSYGELGHLRVLAC